MVNHDVVKLIRRGFARKSFWHDRWTKVHARPANTKGVLGVRGAWHFDVPSIDVTWRHVTSMMSRDVPWHHIQRHSSVWLWNMKIAFFRLMTLNFDLWPSNSSEILSRYIPVPNLGFLGPMVQLWDHWQTDTHTHRWTGPILLPRPLMQEVKRGQDSHLNPETLGILSRPTLGLGFKCLN